ncbi:hypothetical protein V8G54_035188 [Vigna mungo]|uniref:Uncharacterized protein n=1 Tax=Vigna mungo TaxID=3915 RepID=A0AAQ3MEU5_VIGMU
MQGEKCKLQAELPKPKASYINSALPRRSIMQMGIIIAIARAKEYLLDLPDGATLEQEKESCEPTSRWHSELAATLFPQLGNGPNTSLKCLNVESNAKTIGRSFDDGCTKTPPSTRKSLIVFLYQMKSEANAATYRNTKREEPPEYPRRSPYALAPSPQEQERPSRPCALAASLLRLRRTLPLDDVKEKTLFGLRATPEKNQDEEGEKKSRPLAQCRYKQGRKVLVSNREEEEDKQPLSQRRTLQCWDYILDEESSWRRKKKALEARGGRKNIFRETEVVSHCVRRTVSLCRKDMCSQQVLYASVVDLTEAAPITLRFFLNRDI